MWGPLNLIEFLSKFRVHGFRGNRQNVVFKNLPFIPRKPKG